MLTSAVKPVIPTFADRLGEIQAGMERVLDDLLGQPAGSQGILVEAMRHAVLGGGKRLRPFLTIETASLFGPVSKEVWKAAAALEYIHAFSLIHDDLPCMDNDDWRRGKPTTHKVYGEGIAVLAGDALQCEAFGIMAGLDLPDDLKIELIGDLSRASSTFGMVGGQVMDITVRGTDWDEAGVKELQRLKTGALIEYAVVSGAKLGMADVTDIEKCRRFARDMGLAFQIRDDILDAEGDAEIVGKAVGKDAAAGKATFVSIFGIEGARQKAQELGAGVKAHLAAYGARAHILCDTVDFVLTRQK
ncbi:MAG: polyprenyl synthetase family protein [Hyphomonadaceae bacterium]|nr:polyprenyl synthetase family protein [Hyphomonadaceae bacterium]MBC6412974.1 polyprenyl synthetase family protein [Hyphomonadaceae bacterium]